MSFNVAKVIKPKKIEEVEDDEIKELKQCVMEKIDCFNLKPLLKDQEKCAKLNLNSYEEVRNAQMIARANVMKIMNVIRYISPVLKIATKEENTDEGRAKKFVDITQRMSEYARQTMILWNISPEDENNRWILNVLIRTYTTGFGENMLIDKVDIEKLSMEIFNVSEMLQEKKYDQSKFGTLTSSIKLSIIKSLSPIYDALNTHRFLKKDQYEDMEQITKFIVNKTTFAIEELVHEMTEEIDRVMLFKVLMEESGKMFADIWNLSGEKFNKRYENATQKEWEVLKQNNPNGISILDYCCNQFEKQHDNVIKLAKMIA